MRIIDCHDKTILPTLLADGAPEIQYIDVTPAGKRFWQEDKEYYDLTEDFPCVVPPFQATWMEYAPPHGLHPGMTGVQFGCFAFSVPIKRELWRDAILQDVMMQLILSASNKHQHIGSDKDKRERREKLIACANGASPVDWVAVYRVVMMDRRNRLHEMTNLVAYLDENGQIVPELHMIYRFDYKGNSVEQMRASQISLMPFLFALSLCHAKNVTIEDEPLPPKVRQKRQDKGYRVDFKILQIHPYQQRKNSETNNANIMPLHLVRGHFKDYRKGDGLFGKIKKLVWFDMHTRGNPEIGMVVKDYEV